MPIESLPLKPSKLAEDKTAASKAPAFKKNVCCFIWTFSICPNRSIVKDDRSLPEFRETSRMMLPTLLLTCDTWRVTVQDDTNDPPQGTKTAL
jgi:hypothetical protein